MQGRACCVLVVDDEHLVLNLISRFLERLGCEVETCLNGADALVCLEQRSFDVLLLDVRMPGMNGVELFAHIRDRWPCLVERTGFVTGNIPSESIRSLVECTGRPVLLKPFNLSDIERFVGGLAGPSTG